MRVHIHRSGPQLCSSAPPYASGIFWIPVHLQQSCLTLHTIRMPITKLFKLVALRMSIQTYHLLVWISEKQRVTTDLSFPRPNQLPKLWAPFLLPCFNYSWQFVQGANVVMLGGLDDRSPDGVVQRKLKARHVQMVSYTTLCIRPS
jgi:hypothetical protein